MAETTKTTSKDAPEKEAPAGGVAADTGVDAAGVEVPEEAKVTMHPKQDVVAVPSLRADGTPDQTSGYKQLVEDEDDARKAL